MYVYSFQYSQLEPLNQKQQNMMPKKNSINPTEIHPGSTFSVPPSVQRIQGSRNQEEVQRDQRCRKPVSHQVVDTQPNPTNQFDKLTVGWYFLFGFPRLGCCCKM